MSKIAVMMTAEKADEPMSLHFGKAEWLMIADAENASQEFVKNDAMNGRGAAEIVIGRGCRDVIATDIGDGALRRLQAARIQVWAAPSRVSGSKALQMQRAGELPPVPPAREETKHGEGHGCCCSDHHRAGPPSSNSDSCCRG
jgi:predicted Fe-Mo cluster-binding NifX family protein